MDSIIKYCYYVSLFRKLSKIQKEDFVFNADIYRIFRTEKYPKEVDENIINVLKWA